MRGGADLERIEIALAPVDESLRLELHTPAGPPARVTIGLLSATGQLITVRSYPATPEGTVAATSVPKGSWNLLVSGDATVEVAFARLI